MGFEPLLSKPVEGLFSDDIFICWTDGYTEQLSRGHETAKSGEEMTIPISKRDSGVEELLDRLEADRMEIEQTDIGELEAKIDEAVYDLFDLTNEERTIIEDYLEVF